MNENKNWLLCMIANEMTDNREEYQNMKKFLEWYFKDDEIKTIEPYYLNKKWKEALKINYKDWKEGD